MASDAPVVILAPNAAAISVQYQQAPKLVATTIAKVFRTIGAALVSYIGQQKLSGQVLHVRTGTLRRALYYRLFADPSGLSAGVYIGADIKKAPQAAVQEYGGTIQATHAAHLTIPVGRNLTGQGVMRVSAREFFDHPESLGFARAFVNRAKTAIMGANPGEAAEPVFVLKASVTLPERSYLRAGINERRDWILEQLGANMHADIASSLGGA